MFKKFAPSVNYLQIVILDNLEAALATNQPALRVKYCFWHPNHIGFSVFLCWTLNCYWTESASMATKLTPASGLWPPELSSPALAFHMAGGTGDCIYISGPRTTTQFGRCGHTFYCMCAIESQVFQGSLNAETPLSGEELEVQGRQAVQDGYLRDLSCPAWETPATCCSGDLKCGLICEILLWYTRF